MVLNLTKEAPSCVNGCGGREANIEPKMEEATIRAYGIDSVSGGERRGGVFPSPLDVGADRILPAPFRKKRPVGIGHYVSV